MKLSKRKFTKILGFSVLVLLFPIKTLFAATKKIINPNLTEDQKKIMFDEATEQPFTSHLNNEKRKGFYHCANCGAKLFSSNAKFDSGTGWPSFTESLPGAFKTKIDTSFGMKRIEYHCAKCGVHHGHVFDDGPKINKKRLPSRHTSLGPDRAPHRSFYYAMGETEQDVAKPFVGVVSTWNEAAPCNTALMRQAQSVKKGVKDFHGAPREFCTIMVTDGLAMVHEGMKSSLISREVIAD